MMPARLRQWLLRLRAPRELAKLGRLHDENFGIAIGEWPERAVKAVEMVLAHPLDAREPVAADWGCGRQTVKRLLPPHWRYIPYDRITRSPDTRIVDFNRETPAEAADVVFCLGLLEYVDDFWGTLGAAIDKGRLCVFSYAEPRDEQHRAENGWKWAFSAADIESFLAGKRADVLARFSSPGTDKMWLVQRADA